MTYMPSFYQWTFKINEILANFCVCFWCSCYLDSRVFSIMISLTVEAGESERTLILKLEVIVRKVDIFKSYDCDMNIRV